MPEGFAVQSEKLKQFEAETAKVAIRHQTIIKDLVAARAAGTSELLGGPGDLGASGPPVDFTEASRAMLDNFTTLLLNLHRLHLAIGAQFEHMTTALGETHDLYVRTDSDRAGVFDGLLGDHTPGGN